MTHQPDIPPCPDFRADPVAYYEWHLTYHPEVYRAFRETADRYAERNPGKQISADMICHVLRFEHDMRAEGDKFAVNNNLTAFFARLYANERPHIQIGIRKGYLDTISQEEKDRLNRAFLRVRDPHRKGAA